MKTIEEEREIQPQRGVCSKGKSVMGTCIVGRLKSADRNVV